MSRPSNSKFYSHTELCWFSWLKKTVYFSKILSFCQKLDIFLDDNGFEGSIVKNLYFQTTHRSSAKPIHLFDIWRFLFSVIVPQIVLASVIAPRWYYSVNPQLTLCRHQPLAPSAAFTLWLCLCSCVLMSLFISILSIVATADIILLQWADERPYGYALP